MRDGPLTEREAEVLTLLSFGFGTTEVADELHISYHTVRNHIRNACRNLGTRSTMAAVLDAQSRGLLDASHSLNANDNPEVAVSSYPKVSDCCGSLGGGKPCLEFHWSSLGRLTL